MTDRKEMIAALEAVLFVAPEPVSRQRLMDLFDAAERDEARAALEELTLRYSQPGDSATTSRGVLLEEVAGGLRLVTRPDVNDWLRRFFEAGRSKKLSMGALETLAIVAYRQPVTAPEIQELRSVSPSGVLKTLLERRMIRISGRKEVVGKPFLYGTTQDFLVHFGLRNLKDLPPLEEFEDALASEGLGELLGGTDLEELALREAAEVEERAEDAEEKRQREEEEAQAEAAEGAEAQAEPPSDSGSVPASEETRLQEEVELPSTDPEKESIS